MCLFSISQKKYFNANGSSLTYQTEDIDIDFLPGKKKIAIPREELAPLILAMLPTFVDASLKLTTKFLEKRAKSFAYEYSKQKSNIKAGDKEVPDLHFYRKLDNRDVLQIDFVAEPINGLNGFVYVVDLLTLDGSGARFTKKDLCLDYLIELKITFLINGERKIQELSPITLNSIKFGKNDFSNNNMKHRTDIIPLPKGGVITEVALKITETNPRKINAEQIKDAWDDYKDDVKTIINNFLPKEKSESGPSKGNEDTGNKSIP